MDGASAGASAHALGRHAVNGNFLLSAQSHYATDRHYAIRTFQHLVQQRHATTIGANESTSHENFGRLVQTA